MKIKQYILFLLIILAKNQIPIDKVINSCGKIYNYSSPENADDCEEKGEVCCFIKIQKDNEIKNFCLSAPTMISDSEIADEIKTYTGYNIQQFKCNNSTFIKNTKILILFFMILL